MGNFKAADFHQLWPRCFPATSAREAGTPKQAQVSSGLLYKKLRLHGTRPSPYLPKMKVYRMLGSERVFEMSPPAQNGCRNDGMISVDVWGRRDQRCVSCTLSFVIFPIFRWQITLCDPNISRDNITRCRRMPPVLEPGRLQRKGR